MKQSPFWLAGAAVTLLATPAAIVAQADVVQDLLKEFPAKRSALITDLQKQKPDSPEYKTAVEAYMTYLSDFGKKAMDAVKANPKSPSALNLLTLVLQSNPKLSDDVLELVRTQYVLDPKVGSICSMLSYNDTPAAEALLKEIAAKNPNTDAKATATHALGKRLASGFSVYAQKPVPENEREATIKRAEGYFNAVIALYKDNPKHPMAERARKDLVGLGNVLKLQIGKTAPEIVGEDIDGVKFKLSDYRGRVIMLDFWGNW
jgi:hypothetical protein